MGKRLSFVAENPINLKNIAEGNTLGFEQKIADEAEAAEAVETVEAVEATPEISKGLNKVLGGLDSIIKQHPNFAGIANILMQGKNERVPRKTQSERITAALWCWFKLLFMVSIMGLVMWYLITLVVV